MTRALVLLLALSAAARADLAQFDAGPDPKEGAVYSDDGYHFASFESAAGEECKRKPNAHNEIMELT